LNIDGMGLVMEHFLIEVKLASHPFLAFQHICEAFSDVDWFSHGVSSFLEWVWGYFLIF
jgi:hypothetical protein